MVDAEGQPLGEIGVLVDITERLADERALVEARDYMRAVAEGMGQGLLTLDIHRRISYANPAAEALLGWSQDELRGRDLADLVAGADGADGAGEVPDAPDHPAARDCVPVRADDAMFRRHDRADLPVAYTATPFETVDGVQGRGPALRGHLGAEGRGGRPAARRREAGLDQPHPGRPRREPVRPL
jgi:PAS domain-containing protein